MFRQDVSVLGGRSEVSYENLQFQGGKDTWDVQLDPGGQGSLVKKKIVFIRFMLKILV